MLPPFTLVPGGPLKIAGSSFVINVYACGEGRAFPPGVRLFAITRPGLLATSLAVLALWACVAGKRAMEVRAARDLRISREVLYRLREQTAPAAEPLNPFRAPRSASS